MYKRQTLFFNAFAIERNSEGKRSGSSRSLLERRVPLLIFPEGGRSKTGVMGHFKHGAAALSIATKVPCLPIALVGAVSYTHLDVYKRQAWTGHAWTRFVPMAASASRMKCCAHRAMRII